jgi:hypothetical protein
LTLKHDEPIPTLSSTFNLRRYAVDAQYVAALTERLNETEQALAKLISSAGVVNSFPTVRPDR